MTIARAVLLVGSAKPAGTSTSEVLGRYLCARLAERGVATTVLFVGSIFTPWAVVWGSVPVGIAATWWFWPKRSVVQERVRTEVQP